MASKEKETLKRLNRGVHVNENDFQASSEITIAEMDTEFNHRAFDNVANDADQSSASNDADHSNSQKSTSENEAHYYRMKTSSRKGLKERPSVITFQQWNPKVVRSCYKRRFPHTNRSRWELSTEKATNIQQNSSNINFVNPTDSFPDHTPQPQSLRSKLRLILSRFRREENENQNNFDDIEKGRNEAEFYHFDHGEPTHYRITDSPPHVTSDLIAQRVHDIFTKFWAEFFGYINLVVTFIITFFIQFFRFILYGIFQALFIGLLQTSSDYLLKPVLAFTFNGLLQPFFTLFRNIFQSISEMTEPLGKMVGNMLRPFTECVRAFRVIEVKNLTKQQQQQPQPESRMAESRTTSFQGQSNDI